MKNPLIALLTDFGEEDFFVPSLKGVILGVNPEAKIVDITHKVRSYDVFQAGFILFSCYRFFPSETIFLCIVDPGVGSSRSILLVKTKNHYFIAPDNGLLSFVLEAEQVKELREVTNTNFFLSQPSKTFEGRDKMAPVAAWLSKGTRLASFGKKISQYQKFSLPRPEWKDGEIVGSVVYIDKFGNLITNIPYDLVNFFYEKMKPGKVILQVGQEEIDSFLETYNQGEKGKPFFLVDSLGFLEVSLREASAAEKLSLRPLDRVRIKIRKD